MNACDTFFNNTLDFLEEVRIFLVYPMCHISSIIEDLKKKRPLTNFYLQVKTQDKRYYWSFMGKWSLKTLVPCLAPSPPHLHSDQYTTRSHPQILLSMQTLENLPWRAEGKTRKKSKKVKNHMPKNEWQLDWEFILPCSAKAAATSSWVE